MSYLPKAETDIRGLVTAGYTVTYTDSDDSFTDSLDLHDCFRESITKNGKLCSLDNDMPATKWFDNKSGKLVAAAWYNDKGQFHRKNAPAFVCERSTETGACGNDEGYRILGYLENGAFHNPIGAAHICDEFYKDGRVVRTLEDYYFGGVLRNYIRRDSDTGEIVPEVSSPLYSRSPQNSKLKL